LQPFLINLTCDTAKISLSNAVIASSSVMDPPREEMSYYYINYFASDKS
jgi:hypothetical protein